AAGARPPGANRSAGRSDGPARERRPIAVRRRRRFRGLDQRPARPDQPPAGRRRQGRPRRHRRRRRCPNERPTPPRCKHTGANRKAGTLRTPMKRMSPIRTLLLRIVAQAALTLICGCATLGLGVLLAPRSEGMESLWFGVGVLVAVVAGPLLLSRLVPAAFNH